MRPRSGLASRHGVTLVNSPGTIDSDYRGEVMVPLINHGREPFIVERGMRIAQMLVLPVPPVRLVEVDELDETSRGAAAGSGTRGTEEESLVICRLSRYVAAGVRRRRRRRKREPTTDEWTNDKDQ